MWFRKNKKPSPPEVARELRDKAFAMSAAELNLTPTPARPNVWGVVMETVFPGNVVVSLVVFGEGSASLYFSSGGGVIGGGGNAAVRQAVDQLLGVVEQTLAGFTPASELSRPAAGEVRFYARTFNGTLAAGGSEEAMKAKQHPLSLVFYASHAVIAALRQATG